VVVGGRAQLEVEGKKSEIMLGYVEYFSYIYNVND